MQQDNWCLPSRIGIYAILMRISSVSPTSLENNIMCTFMDVLFYNNSSPAQSTLVEWLEEQESTFFTLCFLLMAAGERAASFLGSYPIFPKYLTSKGKTALLVLKVAASEVQDTMSLHV